MTLDPKKKKKKNGQKRMVGNEHQEGKQETLHEAGKGGEKKEKQTTHGSLRLNHKAIILCADHGLLHLSVCSAIVCRRLWTEHMYVGTPQEDNTLGGPRVLEDSRWSE